MALVFNVLFTTCVIAAVVRSSTACPASCICTSNTLNVSVSCRDESVKSIPSDLPENTSSIDLTGNPIKCDCTFYQSWKVLKEKRVEILGKCSNSSAQLSGASFQDLKDGSFACDGSSALINIRETKQASTAAVNVLTSSSVVAEKTSHINPELAGGEAIKSSQPARDEITSSFKVPVMTSAHVVTSRLELLVVKPSTPVAVLLSSQIVPAKSSKAVSVLSSSQVVSLVTSYRSVLASTKAVPVVIPGQQTTATASYAAGETSAVLDVAGLAATPSRPPAKPVGLAITTTSRMLEFSSSVVEKIPSSSTVRVDGSSPIIRALSSPSSDFQKDDTSTADILTTVSSVLSTPSSVAATTPPMRSQGAPVIAMFDTPKKDKVGFNTVVQVKCVSKGNPRPVVAVVFNGQPAEKVEGVTVTSSESESESEKMIEFKAVRDSEIWCVASNDLGMDNRKMKIAVDQTGVKYLLLQVELIKEEFNTNMNNKESKEFQDIDEKLTSQVRNVLSQDPDFVSAHLVKLWKGSVKADILVKTFQDNDDSVEKTLKAEVEKAKIGNVPVDRYKYSFEPTQACASEFVNVTWNDAAFGETAVVSCPRGAKGFAKRNCSIGKWKYPDYTNCKSDAFVSLRDQMNSSASLETVEKPENEFLSVLRNLLNLTVPNEDFAIMAGDLGTSTEILQLMVRYIKDKKDDQAHSENEIKHVLEVASRVLHVNNEQEFIVAQRFKQTASKFILVLEEYGRQAARVLSPPKNRNLAILKTQNVVMGAGVAYPTTITEDVTFPNYGWPELMDVKTKWNASTFVVLPLEMIKSMNDDKNGIRISGFTYKTLTRILSFESAYSDKGLAFEINSAVISISMDPKPSGKLTEPVTIASNNLHEVNLEDDEEPICAFWDFKMNAPHGGWSKEGCNISAYNRIQTTCQCDHMTNFAVLRSKPLSPEFETLTNVDEDFIHCIYIAAWIIIAFAVLTFLILLVLSPWLEPDRTWAMHMCVCVSVIVTFVLILLGLASYNDLGLCNLFSFLVHYFFLCTFSWILTEGVYMRTWLTDKGPRKRYWIGYFLLGWGLPGVVVFITWIINKLLNFHSFMSCWMSIFNPLIWVFFVPAVVFFLVSWICFVTIWRAITGQRRQTLKNYYGNTRFRVRIRYSLILMLMFMLTWLIGILLVTYYKKALLCILFIICCIITGFMLLLFYVIMDRQVRDAFKFCCCGWRRSRRGSYWVARRGEVLKPGPTAEYKADDDENQRQRLVSEGTEPSEPDQNIELNGVDKSHEYEEPLISTDSGPKDPPFKSSTESFDPLYEPLRHSPFHRKVPPSPSPSEDGPKPEPIYKEVIKPKRPRHPESDSDDDDDVSWMRGLTREQVIRMSKKSDASKKVLKQYESPSGSKDLLGGPVYLMNQQELDDELKQFRKFFDHGKTAATSTPRTDQSADSPTGTFKKDESALDSPDSKTAGTSRTPQETVADSSLRELDRRHHAENENRPTDV
ncbi:uncharacterized protein [Montipora foliosa]